MINWKKEGKATSVVAFLFTGLPLLLGLWLVFVMHTIPQSPVFFIILLFILLFLCISLLIYSKVPNILSSNYFTFGLNNIIKERRKYYKASYILLAISIALTISIIVAVASQYHFLVNQ